MVAYKDMTLE
jgi:P-type Ca2+ transporter type 2B